MNDTMEGTNDMFEHQEHGRRAAFEESPANDDRFGGGRFRAPRGRGHRGAGGGRGGGRGPLWVGGNWAGRGRARRGDVRIALLALVAERPMHGYEMIQELSERTAGAWSPSPGSVYPTLTLLEEEGRVNAEEVDGKRRFTITEAGQAVVDAREGAPPWEQFADEDAAAHDLREVVGTTVQAVKQVFRAGTPAQQAKALEILSETRRRLYEILASED